MIALNQAKLPFYSKVFLLIIYTVGVVGMAFKPSTFTTLTPYNLILSGAILFYFHEPKDHNFFRFILFVFAAGFAIELLGVESGKIFGSYHYGDALGFKIKETPLIIGLNWVVLAYCSATIVQKWSAKIFVRSILGALLMVVFDFFIEQVAASADFWYWANDEIPFQNFIAWFAFSFFFNLLFCNFNFKNENPLALFLFLIQLVFFILLNLFQLFIR